MVLPFFVGTHSHLPSNSSLAYPSHCFPHTHTFVNFLHHSIFIHTLYMTKPPKKSPPPNRIYALLNPTYFPHVRISHPIYPSDTHDASQTVHFHRFDS